MSLTDIAGCTAWWDFAQTIYTSSIYSTKEPVQKAKYKWKLCQNASIYGRKTMQKTHMIHM
jgi:hypothetical protein